MTGTLNMLTQNQIDFQDAAGGNYVGINAPVTVPTSYTLSLPSTVPTINQTLHAGPVTPTNLVWTTDGGSVPPAQSETIYVAVYGNDITGNGSFDAPYASLAQAISVANAIASASLILYVFSSIPVFIQKITAPELLPLPLMVFQSSVFLLLR